MRSVHPRHPHLTGMKGHWKYSLILLLLNLLYLYLGTQVFMYIEARWERSESVKHWETKMHYMEHLEKHEDLLPRLLALQQSMCKKNNAVEKSWHFTGAFTYCLSILSTVGYGVMTPHDTLSRGVTMLYSILGLPLYAVYLSYAQCALGHIMRGMCYLALWCWSGGRRKRAVRDKEKMISSDTIPQTALDALITPDNIPYLERQETTETTASSSTPPRPHSSPTRSFCESTSAPLSVMSNKVVMTSQPRDQTNLYLNLGLSVSILLFYLVILLVWSPLQDDETITDEVYYLIIRFTTVGFGDEFRDISRTPQHLPGIINAMVVALVVLPLGVTIVSHLFRIYRKIAADRARVVAKVRKCTLQVECVREN